MSETDQDELERLRKEVGRLRMERDILKKVASGKVRERGIVELNRFTMSSLVTDGAVLRLCCLCLSVAFPIGPGCVVSPGCPR